MFINKQIKNIYYSINRSRQQAPFNILYYPSYSFFDAAMHYSYDNNIIPLSLNSHKISDYIYNTQYSGLWINDILEFSQHMPDYAQFYTNYILTIHSRPSNILKKEDLAILKKHIDQYKFISFIQNKEWPMKDVRYIPYGLIENNLNIDKTKDIIILNLKKQKQVYILYQYIKQKYQSTDLVDTNPLNIDQIHKLLNSYKVCIDLDNYYNLLVANSCGAYGIGTYADNDKDFILTVNDINKIFDLLPQLLKYDNHREIKEYSIDKYNWKTFNINIRDFINNLNKEGFVI